MWTQATHCTDQDLLLAADGELSPRGLSRVNAHIASCDICRERHNRMQSTLLETIAGYRNDSAIAAHPDDGRAKLAGALRACAEEHHSWWFNARVWSLPPFRAAAYGAGVVAAVTLFLSLMSPIGRSVGDPSPLPSAGLTPGAVSGLTAAELCSGVRPSRLVTERTRRQVLRAYEMEHVDAKTYELDALITPELGGTTDPANLWPQHYDSPIWNARVKDALEVRLPELVCAHRLELAQAQRELASDWVGAYKKYFNTNIPLQAHRGPAVEDDVELVFLPADILVADAGALRLWAWR